MCDNCGIWGASDSSSDPFELSEEDDATFRAGAPWVGPSIHNLGGGVCDCTDGSCVDAVRALEQRHEFHMLDPWHAYCICGWTGDDRLLAFDDSTAPAAFIGMLYREHLDL